MSRIGEMLVAGFKKIVLGKPQTQEALRDSGPPLTDAFYGKLTPKTKAMSEEWADILASRPDEQDLTYLDPEMAPGNVAAVYARLGIDPEIAPSTRRDRDGGGLHAERLIAQQLLREQPGLCSSLSFKCFRRYAHFNDLSAEGQLLLADYALDESEPLPEPQGERGVLHPKKAFQIIYAQRLQEIRERLEQSS